MWMALSTEEKAKRKEQFKVRDRLHQERSGAFRTAYDEAVAQVEARHKESMEKTGESVERLRDERNTSVSVIRAQIAALNDEIAKCEEQYEPLIKKAHEQYNQVNNTRLKELHATQETVRQQFPDLHERECARYSAAGWASDGLGKEMLNEVLKSNGLL
jgi:TolA-binding protein